MQFISIKSSVTCSITTVDSAIWCGTIKNKYNNLQTIDILLQITSFDKICPVRYKFAVLKLSQLYKVLSVQVL